MARDPSRSSDAPRVSHPDRSVPVVAAVIERDGRYLVGLRPAHKRHGGLWEFPGGKIQEGETDAEAVSRELTEELGMRLKELGDLLFEKRDPGSPYVIRFLVADASGVHGFNRLTGTHVSFVDFTNLEIGFLNDVVEGVDGNLYVTDTGTSTVFVIEESTPSVLVDSLPAPPNGITTDPEGKLVLGPWQGIKSFPTVSTSPPGYSEYIVAESGGNFDGIEFLNGRMIAASQMDSSLHVFYQGNEHIAIKTPGKPADIGLDTKRNQIAVPYIDLNTVDIWQLPERK